METYRIIPRSGVYTVEAFEPGSPTRIMGTWRSEAAAVAQPKDLRAQAERAEYKPAQGELGWHPGAR